MEVLRTCEVTATPVEHEKSAKGPEGASLSEAYMEAYVNRAIRGFEEIIQVRKLLRTFSSARKQIIDQAKGLRKEKKWNEDYLHLNQ